MPVQQLLTPIARLSYPNLFRARAAEEGATPKFGASLIFDAEAQKSPEWAKLRAAVAAKAQEAFGADWQKLNLRFPFRDGTRERADDPAYAGCVFFNCTSARKAPIVDGNKLPISDESVIYAGCYVRAFANPFDYTRKGNKGVSFGLLAVQKVRDGEPLSASSRIAEEFGVVETSATDGLDFGKSGDDELPF